MLWLAFRVRPLVNEYHARDNGVKIACARKFFSILSVGFGRLGRREPLDNSLRKVHIVTMTNGARESGDQMHGTQKYLGKAVRHLIGEESTMNNTHEHDCNCGNCETPAERVARDNIEAATVARLMAFNLQIDRDYTEVEMRRAVKVHGIYAAKTIMHDRTVRTMAR